MAWEFWLVMIPIVVVGAVLVVAFVRRRRVAPVYLNGEDVTSTVAGIEQQQPSVTRAQPYGEPPVDRG